MKGLLISLLACFLLLQFSEAAFAHKASDSYLRFNIEGKTIQGQWDIALRDLDVAIGVDRNDDGQITWGELRTKQEAIEHYALPRLIFKQNMEACWSNPQKHLVDSHTDGAYAVL
ncbi:MAG: HupE/UreJ family protein, partial [Nitrospirales bacterium]